MKTPTLTYTQWLASVYREVENALDCTTSDAQGVTDAQPFALAQAWGAGLDAIEAAAAVIKAGSKADRQTEHSPLPWKAEGHYIHGPDGIRFLAVSGDKTGVSAEANAAFIALAVNNHAALVAALQSLRDAAMNTPALDSSKDWTALILEADQALRTARA